MTLMLVTTIGNASVKRFNFTSDPDTIIKYQLSQIVQYAIIENEYLNYLVSCEALLQDYKKEYKQIRMKNLQIKILIFTTCFFSVCFIGVVSGVVTYAVMKANGF